MIQFLKLFWLLRILGNIVFFLPKIENFLVYAIVYGISIEMDTGTRAFVLALYSDFFPCIAMPAVLYYSAPVFRDKISTDISKFIGIINKILFKMSQLVGFKYHPQNLSS